eukprot:scaffold118429_cov59-Phaeocystis_antarctica.AAC.12
MLRAFDGNKISGPAPPPPSREIREPRNSAVSVSRPPPQPARARDPNPNPNLAPLTPTLTSARSHGHPRTHQADRGQGAGRNQGAQDGQLLWTQDCGGRFDVDLPVPDCGPAGRPGPADQRGGRGDQPHHRHALPHHPHDGGWHQARLRLRRQGAHPQGRGAREAQGAQGRRGGGADPAAGDGRGHGRGYRAAAEAARACVARAVGGGEEAAHADGRARCRRALRGGGHVRRAGQLGPGLRHGHRGCRRPDLRHTQAHQEPQRERGAEEADRRDRPGAGAGGARAHDGAVRRPVHPDGLRLQRHDQGHRACQGPRADQEA